MPSIILEFTLGIEKWIRLSHGTPKLIFGYTLKIIVHASTVFTVVEDFIHFDTIYIFNQLNMTYYKIRASFIYPKILSLDLSLFCFLNKIIDLNITGPVPFQ